MLYFEAIFRSFRVLKIPDNSLIDELLENFKAGSGILLLSWSHFFIGLSIIFLTFSPAEDADETSGELNSKLSVHIEVFQLRSCLDSH